MPYIPPQLLNSVGLVYILGQSAYLEVTNKRSILSYIGWTLYSYSTFTGLAKLCPRVKLCAARLSSIILLIAIVTLAAENHGGQIIFLPAPCTQPIIHRQCKPSRQDYVTPIKSSAQAKGTMCNWISCSNGLIFQPMQPLLYIGNLTQLHHSFMLVILQVRLSNPCGIPLPKHGSYSDIWLALGQVSVQSNGSSRPAQSNSSFLPFAHKCPAAGFQMYPQTLVHPRRSP